MFPKGPKYVWDLDDYLESSEATTSEEMPLLIASMQVAFKKADLVIFGSEKLAQHYKSWYNGKSEVMEDYIDPCTHRSENKWSDRKIPKVGYFGNDYYKKEVQDLLPSMKRFVSDGKCTFAVIGVENMRDEIEAAGCQYIPYNNNYAGFNKYLASFGFDVGIVWYDKDKEVNIAKTHLKWSEWSWLGIPTVSSRFVVEDFVLGSFTCFADNIDDIRKKLGYLLIHKDECLELGKWAQQYAQTKFSLHDRVSIYTKLFEEISG
jgi:hypothetical protein